jgi:hypothetical protein
LPIYNAGSGDYMVGKKYVFWLGAMPRRTHTSLIWLDPRSFDSSRRGHPRCIFLEHMQRVSLCDHAISRSNVCLLGARGHDTLFRIPGSALDAPLATGQDEWLNELMDAF